jgi:hypothetical protein
MLSNRLGRVMAIAPTPFADKVLRNSLQCATLAILLPFDPDVLHAAAEVERMA